MRRQPEAGRPRAAAWGDRRPGGHPSWAGTARIRVLRCDDDAEQLGYGLAPAWRRYAAGRDAVILRVITASIWAAWRSGLAPLQGWFRAMKPGAQGKAWGRATPGTS